MDDNREPPPERMEPAERDGAIEQTTETRTEAPETSPSPPPDPPEDDHRSLALKADIEADRVSHFEVRGIAHAASYFSQFGETAPMHMANLLETKQCFEFEKTGGDRPAETVANEIFSDAEPLIAQLQNELGGSGLTSEQIDDGVASIREVLYNIVAKETLSGGKLRELVGSIHFKEQPDTGEGGEASGFRADASKFQGMTILNEQTGKFDIYFYGSFFKGDEKSQTHLVRHELSHVFAEATNLFDAQTYDKFLQYAGDSNITDEQISEIAASAEELAEILRIMRNPQIDLDVWNGYIKHRISVLNGLEGEDLADERRAVASELVAEMIAPYLASGENEIAYLTKRFETLNQDNILQFFISRAIKSDGTPCQNNQEFIEYCDSRGIKIDVENIKPQELITALSDLPEFSSVFGIGRKFFNKLKGSFENRGANIAVNTQERYFHQEEELGDYDELINFSSYYNQEYGYPNAGSANQSSGLKQESFFSKLWDFVTGRNKKPTAKKIGSVPKPA